MSDTILKVDCNNCGPQRDHKLLATHKKTDEIEGCDNVYTLYTSEVLECCGCHNITLRQTSWFSEDHYQGPPEYDYYPPRVWRKSPAWADQLPTNEKALLNEVYIALHADSRRLAMMGARALIDIALASKVGDQGAFAKTLAEGEAEGYISKINRTVLEAAFDAGSAAAHRGHIADSAEVNQVIDIVENLLQTVYVLESLADNLKKKTPARSKPAKKKTV